LQIAREPDVDAGAVLRAAKTQNFFRVLTDWLFVGRNRDAEDHAALCSNAFRRLQRWVQDRFRIWLWKKYDKTLGRYTFFTSDRLHGQYQLWKIPTTVAWNR
jgi:hypothetical protein